MHLVYGKAQTYMELRDSLELMDSQIAIVTAREQQAQAQLALFAVQRVALVEQIETAMANMAEALVDDHEETDL